jgi:hypothetical protein
MTTFKVSFQNGSIKLRNGVNGFSMMKGQSSGGTSPINLDTIAAYLRNYATTASTSGGLRTPDFFEYELDGDEYYINDGGNDMFDEGNWTGAALLDNTTYLESDNVDFPLAYDTTITSTTDTNFYYVSLGYGNEFRPLTMLGTRSGIGNPIGFQKAGNLGADGYGDLVYGSLYNNQVINNFTTYAWYRQTHGQNNDPSVCDLYILLGHSAWNSVFDSVESVLSTDTDRQGAQFRAYGANTQNILAISTLLSRDPNTDPRQIPESEIQTVVQNYTTLIGQALNI